MKSPPIGSIVMVNLAETATPMIALMNHDPSSGNDANAYKIGGGLAL